MKVIPLSKGSLCHPCIKIPTSSHHLPLHVRISLHRDILSAALIFFWAILLRPKVGTGGRTTRPPECGALSHPARAAGRSTHATDVPKRSVVRVGPPFPDKQDLAYKFSRVE